jgi:hypothetical protein
MTRAELMERIDRMSDEEMERIGPYLEADLELIDDLGSLHQEIELGRVSARDEPLGDHADVMDAALARLRARS